MRLYCNKKVALNVPFNPIPWLFQDLPKVCQGRNWLNFYIVVSGTNHVCNQEC